MSNPNGKRSQAVNDKIEHVRNRFRDVEMAHLALSQSSGLDEDDDYSKAEELELWAAACGAYHSCELDEIAACDVITSHMRRQMNAAIDVCTQYLNQFHRRAVLANLTA